MSLAKKMFLFGGLCVAGLSIFGNAVHWFLTPAAHPAASSERMLAVGLQALAGIALAIYSAVRANRETAAPLAENA
jgi:hypothetical protein